MNLNTTLLTLCAITGLACTTKAEPATTNTWEHSLALGVSATSGNTDTKLYSLSWLSEFRRLNSDLVRISVDGQSGENEGVTNAENIKGAQNYKHLISDRAYISGDLAEFHDSIADIDYRVNASLGIGYFLIKNAAASLSLDIGPGYQWEKIGGVEDDFAVLRIGERYERKLSATAKCWQAIEYTPKAEDFEIYTISGEIGAEAALTSTINLRAVFKDQYINVPAAGRDRNDTQIIAAIAMKI